MTMTTTTQQQQQRRTFHTNPRARQQQQQKSSSPAAAAASSSSSSSDPAGTAKEPAQPSPTPSSSPPSPPTTHYALFPATFPAGPPPAGPFAVDVAALRREFLRLQAAAHPDKHAGAGKAGAGAASARLNDAFRALACPLARARHLLDARGVVDDEDEETARVADPALLALVLEAREAIEEAADEDALAGLRRDNEARIARSEGVLDRAFRADDLRTAREEVVRLRYWLNIRQSIDDWVPGKPVVLQHEGDR
ncbi:Co-chaperone Hsc20 [Xylariomycetidae sp. FL0641]|nr:Co-chaperone Hsc20 [Xylariomycetidae sp. FL0641]